ncbi:MAG: hypothetical protein AB2A00_28310 [Myxococcota bacterium]
MSTSHTGTQQALQTALAVLRRANLETVAQAQRVFSTPTDAEEAFLDASARLFDINHWGNLGPRHPLRAEFLLHDEEGFPVERMPRPGDHIRMGLPPSYFLPGHALGGPDWVRVESVEAEEQRSRISVRPSPRPASGDDIITHFFTDQSLNHFVVERDGLVLTATVRGDHEYANVDPYMAGGVTRAVRNLAVAVMSWGLGVPRHVGGQDSWRLEPLLGMHKLMWKPFTRNLVGD